MNEMRLAQTWASGDLPFRPQWVAKKFVMRTVSKSPGRAALVALWLEKFHGPGAGQTFAANLVMFTENPTLWQMSEKLKHQKLANDWRGYSNWDTNNTLEF